MRQAMRLIGSRLGGSRLTGPLLAGALLAGVMAPAANAAGWVAPAHTGTEQATFYGHSDRAGAFSKVGRQDWRHFRRGHGHRYARRSNFRRCEEITSLKRIGFGRKAVIAETLCHDKFGRPFIVRGSRRVVGYLR